MIERQLANYVKMAILPTGYIRADAKIGWAGKILQSTLWYAWTEETVNTAQQVVIDFGLTAGLNIAPHWGNLLPANGALAQFDIMAFATTWEPLLSTPYVEITNQPGSSPSNTAGRAQTVNIHFTLDYSGGLTVENRNLPKRSYVQIGPAFETAVQNNNDLSLGAYPGGVFTTFMERIINSMGGANSEVFYPIRVGSENDRGERAWCQILSAYIPEKSGTRKSRNKG